MEAHQEFEAHIALHNGPRIAGCLSFAQPVEYTVNAGDTVEFLPGGLFVTHQDTGRRVQLMKTDFTLKEVKRCCR